MIKVKKANSDIRDAIYEAKLKFWNVADRYGLNDGNFSRMLRKELPLDKKKEIFKIINELRKEV